MKFKDPYLKKKLAELLKKKYRKEDKWVEENDLLDYLKQNN